MSETELQLALSKMVPDKIYLSGVNEDIPRWEGRGCLVEITEWLHVCSLIEQSLTDHTGYVQQLQWVCGERQPFFLITATWKQRSEALLRATGK